MKNKLSSLFVSFIFLLSLSTLKSEKICYSHTESYPERKVWPKQKATPQIQECSCPCTAPRLETNICFSCGHYVKNLSHSFFS